MPSFSPRSRAQDRGRGRSEFPANSSGSSSGSSSGRLWPALHSAVIRQLLSWSLIGVLALGTVGCGASPSGLLSATPDAPVLQPESRRSRVAEVSPPSVIAELRRSLENNQPQLSLLSPKADALLDDNRVEVRFKISDLPVFKDQRLGLGPHLNVFLDDQFQGEVYDLKQPLVLENLEPGSHTLRAFAARPWGESFKNEGAYVQSTFHVFTQTPTRLPNPDLPLITYDLPRGSYGAEPILLDYYLSNAPLHAVAQDDDEVSDWRIRCTINGESFVLDRWQPVYLKGFKKGKNWLKLEFLDEKGKVVENVFNTGVSLIDYQPDGQAPLDRLFRNQISVKNALGVVDANYVPPIYVEPEPAAIESNPVKPEPVKPEPVKPEPVKPEPATAIPGSLSPRM
ncbi:MAG: hypothetical protein HC857_17800 [Synechococcales cyanobacterium RU_4_20]|nr:hypothetical protein [Synechococcales cyanobacterium RU_4_20]